MGGENGGCTGGLVALKHRREGSEGKIVRSRERTTDDKRKVGKDEKEGDAGKRETVRRKFAEARKEGVRSQEVEGGKRGKGPQCSKNRVVWRRTTAPLVDSKEGKKFPKSCQNRRPQHGKNPATLGGPALKFRGGRLRKQGQTGEIQSHIGEEIREKSKPRESRTK